MTLQETFNLFENDMAMKYVTYFFILNLSLVILEIIFDFLMNTKRRWKDTIANSIIFGVGQLIENTFFGALGIICLMPLYWISPFEIRLNTWSWIIGFFTADFTYYWMHRLEHEHRILWANHSVHHSSEDYNLTVSMRLSLIEGAVEWIFLIPMILIGFSPFQAIVCLIIVAQYQTWIHTQKIDKLGFLDEVFNTPSVHRVHHGSNHKYLDKNYGGVLIIWDKLFGTFQREEEKVVYGLTQNINTNNPVTINFIEYLNIWREIKQCQTWRDKFRIIFGGLIWKPDYFK